MVALGIFSLILEPGVEHRMVVPNDFVLTNAALGEDLADANGRSVIKLTHFKISPPDEDDEDEDEDEEEEEEDEEEEEGDVEGEVETVVLTSLTAGKTEQVVLNVTFLEEEEIAFTVTGSNVVHLVGNYVDQEPHSHDHDDEDDDDYPSDLDDYSEDDFDADDMMEFDEDEEDEDEEADESRISEIPEHETVVAAKKAAAAIAAPPKAEKKRSAAAAGLEEVADADTSMVSAASVASSVEGLSKSQKKKLLKKLKGEDGAAAEAPVAEKKAEAPKQEAPKKKEEKASNKKTLPSGLIIEDSKLGSGQAAKAGKKIGMRYIGKLANGKIFDQNTSGAPFKFVLGKGEVIKGWDVGVAGMAIGGERKLTIPAAMAYGSKALPGIPKNSTLHFDVKLVSVN